MALDTKVQAERLTYSFVLHANQGVQTAYWYDSNDTENDPGNPEKNFGVYRVTTPTVRAFQPKEAALAMWVMRN